MNNLSPISSAVAAVIGASADEPRIAPHNLEAEQALLGALLANNEAFDRVSGFLLADHFYEPVNAAIYAAIGKLIGHGRAATPVTLKTHLERDELLREVGGPAYLARVAGAAASSVNAADYARVVYDLAIRRSLIRIGEETVEDAFSAGLDIDPREQIARTEQSLYTLAEKGRYEGGFKGFAEALAEAVTVAVHAYQRDGGLAGVSTGLKDLDEKLGGLHPSDLLILAGRPSMGKTSLATNIAFNAARAYRTEIDERGRKRAVNGAVVGFFSLEMSSEQLATRILAEQAEIDSERIRRGAISEDEYRRLVDAAAELERAPLFIDDTPALPISTLAARARRLKRQHDLGLIVVDYLQLCRGVVGVKNDNRVQEVSAITQGLKAIAKELNVPVIALSQLSRQVEAREDKRPQLSDLRESGLIEQDADVVMFVYREEYYLSRTEPSMDSADAYAKWQEDMNRAHGKADVIIGKQRHGPIGTVKLQFQANVTRFGDLIEEDRLPEYRG